MNPNNPLAPTTADGQPKPVFGLPLPTNDWLAPRRLYAKGFPAGLTSALQVFTVLQTRLRDLVASIDARCVLEVGPGDRPVTDPGPGHVYFDISHAILTALGGARVEGEVTQMPFADGMFDLVVCVDVFTHLPEAHWRVALAEMVRIAPKVIVFNPEPGAQKYAAAPVHGSELEAMLRDFGCLTYRWPVDVGTDRGGHYRFALILAQRLE